MLSKLLARPSRSDILALEAFDFTDAALGGRCEYGVGEYLALSVNWTRQDDKGWRTPFHERQPPLFG